MLASVGYIGLWAMSGLVTIRSTVQKHFQKFWCQDFFGFKEPIFKNFSRLGRAMHV